MGDAFCCANIAVLSCCKNACACICIIGNARMALKQFSSNLVLPLRTSLPGSNLDTVKSVAHWNLSGHFLT